MQLPKCPSGEYVVPKEQLQVLIPEAVYAVVWHPPLTRNLPFVPLSLMCSTRKGGGHLQDFFLSLTDMKSMS